MTPHTTRYHPQLILLTLRPRWKPIWFKAFGRSCFTRLVTRRKGGFLVTHEPVVEHAAEDLEEAIAKVDRQRHARRVLFALVD